MQPEVCEPEAIAFYDGTGLCPPPSMGDPLEFRCEGPDGRLSNLVVQECDASLLADAEGIDDAARRIVTTAEGGKQVIVVVSPNGATRHHLLTLARAVSVCPDSRELAMLLSSGDLISISLLTMSIINLGHDAISFTGEQAGLVTDDDYSRAHIVGLAPKRVVEAVKAAKIVIVAGAQGVALDGNIAVLEQNDDSIADALARTLDAEIWGGIPSPEPPNLNDLSRGPDAIVR